MNGSGSKDCWGESFNALSQTCLICRSSRARCNSARSLYSSFRAVAVGLHGNLLPEGQGAVSPAPSCSTNCFSLVRRLRISISFSAYTAPHRQDGRALPVPVSIDHFVDVGVSHRGDQHGSLFGLGVGQAHAHDLGLVGKIDAEILCQPTDGIALLLHRRQRGRLRIAERAVNTTLLVSRSCCVFLKISNSLASARSSGRKTSFSLVAEICKRLAAVYLSIVRNQATAAPVATRQSPKIIASGQRRRNACQ